MNKFALCSIDLSNSLQECDFSERDLFCLKTRNVIRCHFSEEERACWVTAKGMREGSEVLIFYPKRSCSKDPEEMIQVYSDESVRTKKEFPSSIQHLIKKMTSTNDAERECMLLKETESEVWFTLSYLQDREPVSELFRCIFSESGCGMISSIKKGRCAQSSDQESRMKLMEKFTMEKATEKMQSPRTRDVLSCDLSGEKEAYWEQTTCLCEGVEGIQLEPKDAQGEIVLAYTMTYPDSKESPFSALPSSVQALRSKIESESCLHTYHRILEQTRHELWYESSLLDNEEPVSDLVRCILTDNGMNVIIHRKKAALLQPGEMPSRVELLQAFTVTQDSVLPV